MNGSFRDVSDAPKMSLADAPLAKECDPSRVTQMTAFFEKSLVIVCENFKNCPCENGEWMENVVTPSGNLTPIISPRNRNLMA